MSDTVQPPDALPTGFVRPSHGVGLLRPPWKPGEVPPHRQKGTVDAYQRCQKLCRQRSPEAADEIYNLMQYDADSRIRFMSAAWIYERAWGKPEDYDPSKALANSGLRFDIQALTPEERAVLLAIIRRGAVRQADPDATPETVDAVAEPAPEAQAASPDSTPPPAPKPKRRR